ncbi:ubiquinone anaerobic biosynthesis protein UbiV [Pollutimonas harenae]|uniref:Ubiquinone biosynthesis protein UbiV n=1 Tax=Pollutimonas harenae TaxID=657015 RepID=A0A853GWM6_9BURK|nr:U32 family peptidase [Pollutimonas harenae]NYT86751.1 U32 family peptidase [Pollutimonas harenae]TEA71399.1 U32 family peptidase [Pollutimonas harenae]
MKIALGPVQYYWSRIAMMQFYESMTDTPVDIVYLGETVCSRRHELRLPDWLDIAHMLADAGKDVVLSTQVLLESGQDLATMRKIVANDGFMVEANDMGAVHCLNGKPFVAGPYLNVYSSPTLDLLAGQGAGRWVMPLEMGREGLTQLQAERPQDMQTEVFVYGRMPLAYSARCFTARHRNIPKDNCQYVCMDHPDGLLLETREGQPFLVLNGIQTQSALVYNLVNELDTMCALGVDVLRISPQSQHTGDIVQLFRQVLDRQLSGDHAFEQMLPLMPAGSCNGYWYGRPGLEQMVA